MDRREMLKNAGALALGSFTTSALAAQTPASPAKPADVCTNDKMHEHHHHHASNPYSKVIDTASTCIDKGNLCIAHCLMLLSDGEKEMAKCAQTVSQMLSTCTALQQLASQESKHVVEMAKLASAVCKECGDECKKHADKHEACKNCLDACKACAKDCDAITA